jgi:HKD family nuclease
MSESFFITPGNIRLLDRIQELIESCEATTLSVASAFVTMGGVESFQKLVEAVEIRDVKLIAGTSLCITHPESLRLARKLEWAVKIPTYDAGLFHPKFIIGSNEKNEEGILYIGSANLTRLALHTNLESCWVGMCNLSKPLNSFEKLWSAGIEATEEVINNYALKYAVENSKRTSEHIDTIYGGEVDLEAREDHSSSGISVQYATAVWVELRSFTGDYTLQAEFPSGVATVLQEFVSGQLDASERIDMLCEDGQLRNLLLRFYSDNWMYRINITNKVPNVQWVRDNHNGIVLVERNLNSVLPLRIRIVTERKEVNEVIHRSLALNSLFTTATRKYGWY